GASSAVGRLVHRFGGAFHASIRRPGSHRIGAQLLCLGVLWLGDRGLDADTGFEGEAFGLALSRTHPPFSVEFPQLPQDPVEAELNAHTLPPGKSQPGGELRVAEEAEDSLRQSLRIARRYQKPAHFV